MRKRLIIIGARDEDIPAFPVQTHFPATEKSQRSLLTGQSYVTCWDALSDLPQISSGEIGTKYATSPKTEYQKLMRGKNKLLYNHEASKHKQSTMDYYGLVPFGGTSLDIPKDKKNKKDGIQRWPVDGLSRTITTEPTDYLHPYLNRIPTVRELARIQSFPDYYEFLGQRTTGNKMRRLGYCSQTQQVGNAVPPLLAKAVGEAILKAIGDQTVRTDKALKECA